MKRMTLWIVVVSLLLVVGSLDPAVAGKQKREKHVENFPDLDLSGYSVVYVGDFTVSDPKAADNPKRKAKAQMATRGIPDFLVEVLSASEAYEEVSREAPAQRTGAIALNANITMYKPGSRVGRAMMAGAGKAKLQMDVVITETETGKELISFPVKRTWAWGGLMGASKGIEDMDENVATELAMYLEQCKHGG